MVTGAARLSPRLLDTLVRADDGRVPIAEICRSVGAEAEALGLTRPSYEAVRLVVHLARDRRVAKHESTDGVWDEAARRSAYWFALYAVIRGLSGRE